MPGAAVPVPGCQIWMLDENVTNLNFRVPISRPRVSTANWTVAGGVRPTYLAQSLEFRDHSSLTLQ